MRHEYKRFHADTAPRYCTGSAASALRQLARNNRVLGLSALDARDKQIVGMLTNHERNKWARAGYPGLSNGSVALFAVLPFFAPLRRKFVIDPILNAN